jgi:3-deoxy-D-manno-octulosonic-acid transferase
MGILLDGVYALGLAALSPVWLYRMIRHGRYRRGLGQKFGAAPIRYGLQPIIWIHGVSVGEINAARTLVQEIHGQLPDFQVVITSTTDTGYETACKAFGKDHVVFRWPLDFSLAVSRALNRVRPSLVVLMEGDVWPNFLAACNARGIPVVVVNGRMSENKGYPRYRRLGSFAAKLFNRLTAIGVQDDSYAQRFHALGVDDDKIHVTGMLKFDTAEVADRIAGQDELAAALGLTPSLNLVVGGGTAAGEEEILLEIYEHLRKRHPQVRLALVPRKIERAGEVARLISAHGYTPVRRSARPDGTKAEELPGNAVILGDTMGDLRKFYAMCRCAFVGRSLVPQGGSDMIEAAALGKATAFGPYTFNFPQADALAANGCTRIAHAKSLEATLEMWISNPATAAKAAGTAQEYIRSRKGATKRNVELICRVLNRAPAAAEGSIATDRVAENAPVK